MKLQAFRWTAAAAIALAALNTAPAGAQSLNGAGASFPAPVYAQWAYQYKELTKVQVNYQSIGSGGGIAQIKAKTVDFGASDAPLQKSQLNESNLVQFPMIMGGVVPVVNVEGVAAGGMTLSNAVLADIFLGRVTKWNDPAIAGLNKGISLPDKDITVVRRSDGSGTTNIFTDYLAKVSVRWKEDVGVGKTVNWPVGVGAKGNEGVAAQVRQISGSIGYVEYAYAVQGKMSFVKLLNRDGGEVAPSVASFQAAAVNAAWKPEQGFALFLTDQPGKESWPITGASYILVQKQQAKAETASAMFKFFDWAYKHGKETAEKLHYVAMPDNVVQMVEAVWAKEIAADGKPVWPAN
ncbi:phosphate ABC transporter substrate-binding protein PstS [Candidatus Electronema sp. JM]|uniref:phosphate ABC transporter substrate-binding protein PstS n=1 Tax=Candidatus Electronema sp. JM TaxID=3401571 RepID=UPI003AA84CE4